MSKQPAAKHIVKKKMIQNEETKHDENRYDLSKERIKELKIIYDSVDKNKDQQLNVKELQKLFLKVERELTDYEIKAWLLTLGKETCNFDDFIIYEKELLAKNQNEDEFKEIIFAFKNYDHDEKGFITCEELKKTLTSSGDKFSQEEIDFLFSHADLREDGVINYEKFVKHWKHLD